MNGMISDPTDPFFDLARWQRMLAAETGVPGGIGLLRRQDFIARAGTLLLDPTGRTWCRSGSPAQPERQAEMFAGSLLAPEDRVRASLPPKRRGGWAEVYSLAESFRMTPTAMLIRLEELGLAHRDETGVPVPGRPRDERQGTLFG